MHRLGLPKVELAGHVAHQKGSTCSSPKRLSSLIIFFSGHNAYYTPYPKSNIERVVEGRCLS